jgi:TonB family protein
VNRSIAALALAAFYGSFPPGLALAQPPSNRAPEPPAGSATPDESGAAAPAQADWFETRLAIQELSESGDYAAAAALGDHLLEVAAAEFGSKSKRVAEAHLLLAEVDRGNKDYEAAEGEILDAIEVYEAVDGPLSPVLIDPYLDLGDNYDEAGDYASALSAYSEARNIGRRNFGLLNEDQLEIIDEMSEVSEKLDQVDEARALQLEAVTLVERNHGETSLEAIDADYKYALWLRKHRLYQDERRMYFEIQRIIAQHYDDDPLMSVRMLRARAASYRVENNGESIGLGGLREAVALLEKMPDPPPLLLAEVYLDIGDWNVQFSRGGTLGDDYLMAWELLGKVANGEELRRQWFSQLTVVQMSSLSSRGLTTDAEAPMGHVVVYFTVDPLGRTTDVVVTDSYPPGFKDSAVIRLIRDARFRPQLENGAFTSARRAYRFEFRYEPEDIDDRKG